MSYIINNANSDKKRDQYINICNSEIFKNFLLVEQNQVDHQYNITLDIEVINNAKKTAQNIDMDYYTIDTYFNLGKFKYENELILESYESYNTFGIVENDDNDVAYGGFIRDIVINKDYQVI